MSYRLKMFLQRHGLFVVLCILFLSTSIASTLIVSSIKEWKRCSSSEAKLGSFWTSSLQECAQSCGAKSYCLSFNYFNTAKVCMLLDTDGLTGRWEATSRPCIHVLRSSINLEHVCDDAASGCNIKACSRPTIANADVIGNMYTVGSRLKVQCHQGYVNLAGPLPMVCGKDGLWTNMPTCNVTDELTSFTFGFLRHFDSYPYSLYIVSSVSANVTVSVPLHHFHMEITVDGAAEIQFPNNLYIPDGTGIFPYGIRVESNAPIGLYAENGRTGSSDASVLIPDDHLSTEYVLLSWHDHYSNKAGFIIVGTEDNTAIEVAFSQDPVSMLTLNRNQLYYYETLDELSGTFISSSNNIAVFAGHKCTYVITQFCDHLYEQMPPIRDLQQEFIIAYPYPRYHYALRIIAVEDSTDIELSNGMSFHLNRGQYTNNVFNNETIAITATNKVMVAAYGLGRVTRLNGLPETFDGAMLIVPGVLQFKPEYTMFVPDNVDRCVLMVTYPSYMSSIDNIRLNQGPMVAAEQIEVTMAIRGVYTVIYAEISSGRSVISTIDGTSFGAYLSFFRYKSESWFSLPYKF